MITSFDKGNELNSKKIKSQTAKKKVEPEQILTFTEKKEQNHRDLYESEIRSSTLQNGLTCKHSPNVSEKKLQPRLNTICLESSNLLRLETKNAHEIVNSVFTLFYTALHLCTSAFKTTKLNYNSWPQ